MAKDPEVIIDHDLVAGSAPDGFDFGYDDKTTKTTKTDSVWPCQAGSTRRLQACLAARF